MRKNMLDLYSDYLISSFGATTATGLARLLEGEISHDEVTQWLAHKGRTSAEFWVKVKPYVREIESEEGVLIIDDSIEEKPYTDENEQICWHYDHSKDRQVKGINFLTSLYSSKDIAIPVGYQLITKTEYYVDEKTGKTRRRSEKGKNEYFRELVGQAVKNQVQFRYVANDIWFASAENMNYIKREQNKEFIMPLKSNRKIALSQKDKAQGKYVQLETVNLEENNKKAIYLEGVEFPLALSKQVFVNEDDSIGVLYLVDFIGNNRAELVE
jgi:DDE superfamily endonuclease